MAITWTEVQPAGNVNKNWQGSAVDSDGSVMLACADAGRLYVSTDTGANWSEAQPAGDANRNWRTFAVDSDGLVMLAGVYDAMNYGRLYKGTYTESGGSSGVPKQQMHYARQRR
jgi:photosystem II stability/assembly factor-like uncharacterized protein